MTPLDFQKLVKALGDSPDSAPTDDQVKQKTEETKDFKEALRKAFNKTSTREEFLKWRQDLIDMK